MCTTHSAEKEYTVSEKSFHFFIKKIRLIQIFRFWRFAFIFFSLSKFLVSRIKIQIPHILIPRIIPLRSVQFRSLVYITFRFITRICNCIATQKKKNCWNGLCYTVVRKFMNIQYESKACDNHKHRWSRNDLAPD